MKRKEIKKAIICKGINDFKIDRSIAKTHVPRAGDVAIFRVKEIGKHSSIQGVNGNNAYIFPGDTIMAAFGNRYATGQFEGYVPTGYQRQYEILGKGGAIGTLASMHAKLDKIGPTTLRLIGYATNREGEVINTQYHHEPAVRFNVNRPRDYKVVLSLGASMDSGKTTTAGFLCRGLKAAKKKVAYIKLTGTVYSKDRSFVRDCGAHIALDFSHLGFPSTYLCNRNELLDLYEGLLRKAETIKPDVVVVEIADGLLQRETDMLLNDREFLQTVAHVVFSAGDSLSALHGIDNLQQRGIPPALICGLFTASPLLVEEVRAVSETPVLTIDDLANATVSDYLSAERIFSLSA